MNNDLIEINNSQARILSWGNLITNNGQDVIVCVTGNPGLTNFYKEFGCELHKSTELPVTVIGHAGHTEVPKEEMNILKGKEDLFNLKGQLKHKLDYISNHIDKTSHIHLIGHSIGAWLILELLQDDELLSRVKSINLLFPTIQKMAQSRNGIFLNNIVRKIHKLVVLLYLFVNMLPHSIRDVLIQLFMALTSFNKTHHDNIVEFLKPKVVEKVLFLAYDEMDRVTSLNTDILGKVKHMCNVIYSSNDKWAPTEFMEDLTQFQPQMKMKEVDIDHSFVINSSHKVADMVAEFIKIKI